MLTIYPSLTLALRLKAPADHTAGKPDAHPMAKWCARDFRLGVWQLVLFMNPETTLSIVMEAAPYSTLVERFRQFLPDYFVNLGWDDAQATLAPLLSTEVEYRKNTDRSNTGLMNRTIGDLEYFDGYEQRAERDVGPINQWLLRNLSGGSRPGGYAYPIERFHKWLENASSSAPKNKLALV